MLVKLLDLKKILDIGKKMKSFTKKEKNQAGFRILTASHYKATVE